MAKRRAMVVRIKTDDCKEDEHYEHILPPDTYAVDVARAVEVLYQHLNISDIQMSLEEVEE